MDIQKEVSEQAALQVESEQYLKDLNEFGEGYVEIETCQAYLAEEKEVVSGVFDLCDLCNVCGEESLFIEITNDPWDLTFNVSC